LIFLLLAPDIAGADHLKALSQISRVMSDSQMCGKLRKLNSRDDIYTLLTEAIDQE
jgi:PTS system nitrogen regulatory IIA component